MSLQDDVDAVRRQLEAVERTAARLRTELELLHRRMEPLRAVAAPGSAPGPDEIVPIPDTPYDPKLWRGAEDEGIGRRST